MVKTSLTREAAWKELERARQAARRSDREKEGLQRAVQEAQAAVAAITAERTASAQIIKEHQKALNDAAVEMASARLEAGRLEAALATVSGRSRQGPERVDP